MRCSQYVFINISMPCSNALAIYLALLAWLSGIICLFPAPFHDLCLQACWRGDVRACFSILRSCKQSLQYGICLVENNSEEVHYWNSSAPLLARQALFLIASNPLVQGIPLEKLSILGPPLSFLPAQQRQCQVVWVAPFVQVL